MFISAPDFTGERLRDLRWRLGLTQAEFGDMLGVSQKSISAWEVHGLPRHYTVGIKLLELERDATPIRKIAADRGPRRQPRWR